MTQQSTPAGGVGDLIARVDVASAGALDTHEVQRRLGASDDDRNSPLGAVDMALSYFERRDGRGRDFFGPMFESEEHTYPARPIEMPAEVTEIWEAVANGATEAIMESRLHDLCFVIRRGDVGAHARSAIEAYVELAERYPSASEDPTHRLHVAVNATHYISRALDLARLIRDHALAIRVMDIGATLARRALDDPTSGAGVVLGLVTPLVEDRSCPPVVDALLMEARERYRRDVWHTMSTIGLQITRATNDAGRTTALRREEVEALIFAAEDSEPLPSMLHLQNAAELAAKYGFRELSDTAARKLQELSRTDLGLMRQGFSVTLDGAKVRALIDSVVNQPTWQEALEGLLAWGAPTGRVEENRAVAATIPSIAPLATAFPSTRIGIDGLPTFTVAGDDPSHLLVDQELRTLQLYGHLWAQALHEIGQKWGAIDLDELAPFIGRADHVPDDVARAVGRSLNRQFTGDPEGSAFTVLPKVERIVRELALALGEVVYRPPTSSSPRLYKGLSTLIDILVDRGFDESWSRFMLTYLARQEGLNMRNDSLHGARVDIDEVHAALILVAVLYLSIGFRIDVSGAEEDLAAQLNM
jgi:hypothetical protein